MCDEIERGSANEGNGREGKKGGTGREKEVEKRIVEVQCQGRM